MAAAVLVSVAVQSMAPASPVYLRAQVAAVGTAGAKARLPMGVLVTPASQAYPHLALWLRACACEPLRRRIPAQKMTACPSGRGFC